MAPISTTPWFQKTPLALWPAQSPNLAYYFRITFDASDAQCYFNVTAQFFLNDGAVRAPPGMALFAPSVDCCSPPCVGHLSGPHEGLLLCFISVEKKVLHASQWVLLLMGLKLPSPLTHRPHLLSYSTAHHSPHLPPL